jgi:hypothetical protein
MPGQFLPWTLDGASAVLAVAARDATRIERVRSSLGGAVR